MTSQKLEAFSALLSGKFLKTAEDCEAAGRIAARAYADEWKKLAMIFGHAEGDDPEGPARTEELATEPVESGEGEITAEELMHLVKDLGI